MISNRGILLFSQRHLSTKMKWTQDVLLGVKQKHNHTERAWNVSNNAYAFWKCKYSIRMLCGVLAWNHKLSSKVNLCTYENEVTFSSSALLLLKFSEEFYWNTSAHISSDHKYVLKIVLVLIKNFFLVLVKRAMQFLK